MKKAQRISGLLGVLLLTLLSHAKATETKFVQYDALSMRQLKQNVNASDINQVTLLAYQQLLLTANTLLVQPDPSVVEKTSTPLSGNKNDYLSISRYWWPDPTKTNGLPWIRKDGITNPSTQTDDVDRNRLGVMANMAHVLSLAYYLSGQEKYADKVATVLKTWFIAPSTKMNPHLKYAQSVPGNPNGRRSGILDGRLIPKYVLDAIHIIRTSTHWDTKDTEAVNAWLGEYLTWLTQSKLGQQGAKQTNNHGSWYFFQVASLAYYLNEQAILTNTIEQVKASFEYQFDQQGRQAHELARTRSFFYSCFNLDAITSIASIGDKVNQSFWTYVSSNGASLDKAFNFLLPAVQGGEWPYKTKGIDPLDVAPLIVKFDKHANHKKYGTVLRSIIKQAKPLTKIKAISGKKSANDTLLQLALFAPQYFENN